MFVCLSVINLDLDYLRTGKTEWAETFWDIFAKKQVVQLNNCK